MTRTTLGPEFFNICMRGRQSLLCLRARDHDPAQDFELSDARMSYELTNEALVVGDNSVNSASSSVCRFCVFFSAFVANKRTQ